MKPWSKLLKLILYPFFRKFISMPGRSHSGKISPLTESEREIRERVEWYVRQLAEDIGERNIKQYENLQKAARYIENIFWGLGYEARHQDFTVGSATMKNIEAEVRGRSRPDEIIVIGAHYDTVFGCAGADDNASGIAALLELARLFKELQPERTVRFVAFANEENQNNPWEMMGSYAYAERCKLRGEKIVGMLSLEMLGYYSEAEGSQVYPFPFNLFYPTKGDFLAFVGDYGSRKWVKSALASFRKYAQVPSEGVAAPSRFRDINRSDHWAFWQFGYPGLMITDTSNFRYPHVHTPQDTPDKLDFDKLTRAVSGLKAMVVELANDWR
jgi:Zn-dependent M28 family amino/carboxypeptidase